MPKPKNRYDRRHQQNLVRYQRQIEEIYEQAAMEAAMLGATIDTPVSGRAFSFADYPRAKLYIDALMKSLGESVNACIVNGIRSEWTLANNKNNELANIVFGDNVGNLTPKQYRRYYSTNEQARDAFIERKEAGMNLSQRVWNYTNSFRKELELGLEVGIRSGESAVEMSRDLRQFLKHPDMLFRRVRDEEGNLQLSERAKEFHPGQGVYRSSYMNARRLAATETNIAYRTSDHLRHQQLDFIVGIEIHLSNNHTCLGKDGMPHPFHDICDDLQGRYPKDFKFTGWHPHCRCYVTTILKTEEEIAEDMQKILNGEPVDGESENKVENVPEGFKEWTKANASRIVRANSIPYFMTDNSQYVVDIAQSAYPSTKISEQVAHDSFKEYASRLSEADPDGKIAELYKQLNEEGGKMTDLGKAMLVKQIKEEAARLTYSDLVKEGAVDSDWTWVRTDYNLKVQEDCTMKSNGKLIPIKEKKLDVMIFRDGNGMEFAYPVGLKDGISFSAVEASKTIQELPPYLRKGIERVSFYNTPCPMDDFWKVEYNNPNHSSMATDGGKITFWGKPQGNDFKGFICHEAGHILDGVSHVSSSKEWQDAVAADDKIYAKYLKGVHRISRYAKTNDSEDFAECMRYYITDRGYIKQHFPNRAAYIRRMAQDLSGSQPKFP